MKILDDFMRTVLGQYEDSYNENQVDDSTILGQYEDSYNENQVDDDKNLQCEKQIIQCQITNDRLLGSTSKSLRKKYGNGTVERAINRLAKRRIRGKCSRKAELNELAKKFKPVIDLYFKKKDESFSNGAL